MTKHHSVVVKIHITVSFVGFFSFFFDVVLDILSKSTIFIICVMLSLNYKTNLLCHSVCVCYKNCVTWHWGDIDESKMLFCANWKIFKIQKNETAKNTPQEIESKYFKKTPYANRNYNIRRIFMRSIALPALRISWIISIFSVDLRNKIVPF